MVPKLELENGIQGSINFGKGKVNYFINVDALQRVDGFDEKLYILGQQIVCAKAQYDNKLKYINKLESDTKLRMEEIKLIIDTSLRKVELRKKRHQNIEAEIREIVDDNQRKLNNIGEKTDEKLTKLEEEFHISSLIVKGLYKRCDMLVNNIKMIGETCQELSKEFSNCTTTLIQVAVLRKKYFTEFEEFVLAAEQRIERRKKEVEDESKEVFLYEFTE